MRDFGAECRLPYRKLKHTVNKALPLRGNAIDTLPNTTETDAMHKTIPRKVYFIYFI
jgi:hypothetical protein